MGAGCQRRLLPAFFGRAHGAFQMPWRERNTRIEIVGSPITPHALRIDVFTGESLVSSVITMT